MGLVNLKIIVQRLASKLNDLDTETGQLSVELGDLEIKTSNRNVFTNVTGTTNTQGFLALGLDATEVSVISAELTGLLATPFVGTSGQWYCLIYNNTFQTISNQNVSVNIVYNNIETE